MTLGYHLKSLSIMDNKKVTLTTEELSTLLVAASMWIATAEDPKDPEITEMVERGQAILHKICEITDGNNKTFDLIAR